MPLAGLVYLSVMIMTLVDFTVLIFLTKLTCKLEQRKNINLIVSLRVSISTKKAYANEPQRKGIFKVISELLFMWDSNQSVISESQGVSVS